MTTMNMRAPGALTTADTTDRFGVGAQWTDESNKKRYVYCSNDGATSWTIGVPVGVFLTATKLGQCSFTAVTQLLLNDGTTAVTAVAGVALGTVANGEFGWLQVGGICNDLVTDGTLNASLGGVVADNAVVVDAATEPEAHGIFVVGITDDGAAQSVNCLLKPGGCWLDY